MPEPVKIKVCGVRTPEVALAAARAGADFIGLNFVPESPRFVTVAEASAVARSLGSLARTVGVFKGHTPDQIIQIARAVGLWGVQLHGAWDAQTVDELRGWAVIGAVAFGSPGMPAALACPALSAVLIDAPDPTGLGGGTGTSFDWPSLRTALDQLPPVAPAAPVVLAGGLHAGNVARAVREVRPWAVDVSSGVESSRGVKDVGKIEAFCEAARGAFS